MCEMHYMRQRRNGDPLTAGKPREYQDTSHKRFWDKVNVSDLNAHLGGGTCWLWGGTMTDGYGMLTVGGRAVLAHKWAWEQANGAVPEGLLLDHRCRLRSCANPGHLRLVTVKQNNENLTKLYANNTSGVQGVSWDKAKRQWRASVGHHGKRIHVGRFTNLHDAELAVIAKRNELFTHNDLDREAS